MKNIKTFEQYSKDCKMGEETEDKNYKYSPESDEHIETSSEDEEEEMEPEEGSRKVRYTGNRKKVMDDEVVEGKKVSYKKSGLMSPKKADLDKDGKLSEWELKRGRAIDKSMRNKNK